MSWIIHFLYTPSSLLSGQASGFSLLSLFEYRHGPHIVAHIGFISSLWYTKPCHFMEMFGVEVGIKQYALYWFK